MDSVNAISKILRRFGELRLADGGKINVRIG